MKILNVFLSKKERVKIECIEYAPQMGSQPRLRYVARSGQNITGFEMAKANKCV